MRLILYANAGEVQLGEGGHVSRTDFFCIGGRAHIQRRSLWAEGAGFPQEEWSHPAPCDRSCRVWVKKGLDMPDVIKQEVAVLARRSRI
ncbi:MAG: hypothetical protein Q7S95_00955 [bacterium]|nr:hypothetical protein [bacterium]